MKNTSLCIHKMAQNRLMYNGVPVCTTKQLAQVYGSTEKMIRNNFSRNQSRFSAGKHYFLVEGDELRNLKGETSFRGVVTDNVNVLYLWTERGANRHCKILDTDKAWEQFDVLEAVYFQVKQLALEDKKPHATPQIEDAFMEFFEAIERELKAENYYLVPITSQYCWEIPDDKVLGVWDNNCYYIKSKLASEIYRKTSRKVGRNHLFAALKATGMIVAKPDEDRARTDWCRSTVRMSVRGESGHYLKLVRYRMPMRLTTYGWNICFFIDKAVMDPEKYEDMLQQYGSGGFMEPDWDD